MTLQVVPLLSQGDFLDPQTYKELGWKGAIFAICSLLFVFCVVKGHIKIVGCGPNEGGIREFFGITLWTVGPGPHLHISGLLPVRKVSFASKEVKVIGAAERKLGESTYVYIYDVGVNLRVRNDKESIRRRVYEAEDANRADAENDEALRQAESLAANLLRQVIETGTNGDDVEDSLKLMWSGVEETERGDTSFGSERSTYGYGIKSVNVRSLVERELSEVARAIKEGSLSAAAIAAVTPLFSKSA